MPISDAHRSKWTATVTIALAGMLSACAGVAPVEKMVQLEAGITTARQAEAIVYAPLELKFAEDKYRLAQAAMEDKEYDLARLLADEALLDARLAEVKALSAKAEKEAEALRESIETLRSELSRRQTP